MDNETIVNRFDEMSIWMEGDQGTQDGRAPAPNVLHELEKLQVQRQHFLRDWAKANQV